MSKTAYFRIGVFVISACVIGAAGIIVFGAGTFQEKGIILETYVDESVQGLAVGSPVKYRGVQVGKVDSIDFVYRRYGGTWDDEIYRKYGKWVIIRVDVRPDIFRGLDKTMHDPGEVVKLRVDQGLRVRIASQGITGVSYMEADYLDPERNPVFKPEWRPEFIYIPSAGSTAARLTNSAETVVNTFADARVDVLARDLDKLANELTRAIEEDVKPALQSITSALKDLGPTFKNVAGASEDLGPLVKNARDITNDLAPAVKDVRATTEKLPETVDKVNDIAMRADETLAKVAKNVDELSAKLSKLIDSLQLSVDRDLSPALADIHQTSRDLPEALATLQATLKRVDHLVAGEQDDVRDVVADLRNVLRDVETLSGYASRYPAHILFGEPPPQRERK
jgi:phospholipid/cholesterol/gamma-HCH transport system substrate-binding protein